MSQIHCQEVGPQEQDVLLNSCLGFKQNHTTSTSSSSAVKIGVIRKNRKGDDNVYDFTHKNRGVAIIITNDDFEDKELGYRKGAEHDTIKLDECFQYLGFDTRIAVNMTVYETKQHLKIVAAQLTSDSDFDCLVLAISSHGDCKIETTDKKKIVSDVVHCKDGFIPTNEILEIFSDENCKGLIGKPRLCFIQACRGRKLDGGILLEENSTSLDVVDSKLDYFHEGFTNIITSNPFPCMKDFLVMYATPPGYYAFRRLKEGSWFIIALTKILGCIKRNSTNCDLNKLLTLVLRTVAYNYESSHTLAAANHKKQSPCIYSMLTKSVHLCPK